LINESKEESIFSVIPKSEEECPAVLTRINLEELHFSFKLKALIGGHIKSYLP
jgi:hypothetical protein